MKSVTRMLLPALAVLACTANRQESSVADQASADSSAPLPPALAPSAAGAAKMRPVAFAKVAAGAPAPQATDRKVIRSAELRIELDDVDRARAVAESLTTSLEGLVTATMATSGNEGRHEVALTLRIPNGRFQEALQALRALGHVRVDQSSADDVTRAYQDLEIRLAVKRDLVSRLRALLTNRTARLSDIIEAERELARVVAEVEQMEGERRFLDNQVAMSTIQVTLFHAPVAGPGRTWEPLRDAVRNGLRMFVGSVAAAVTLVVGVAPWIVIVLTGWLAWRGYRRRSQTGSASV